MGGQADRANQQGGVVWRRGDVGGGVSGGNNSANNISGDSSSGTINCDSSGNNISGNTGQLKGGAAGRQAGRHAGTQAGRQAGIRDDILTRNHRRRHHVLATVVDSTVAAVKITPVRMSGSFMSSKAMVVRPPDHRSGALPPQRENVVFRAVPLRTSGYQLPGRPIGSATAAHFAP